MSLSIKDNTVNPRGITPELVLGILIANDVFKENGIPFVITSLNDGIHSDNSAHYEGNGVDGRTRHMDRGKAQEIVSAISLRLNKHYDVILEGNHFHLEYDPKRPE